jgi:nitrogen regulatory protein PII
MGWNHPKRGDRQSAVGAVRDGKNDDGNVYLTGVQRGVRIRTDKSGEAAI